MKQQTRGGEATIARAVTTAGGIVLLVIGAATLAGWLTGFRALTTLGSGYIPIALGTALVVLGLAMGVPALVRDRAEQREQQRQHAQQATQKALDAEYRYRAVVDELPVGVLVMLENGRIETSNPAAERILGVTREQLDHVVAVDPWHSCIHEDGTAFPADECPGPRALRTGRPEREPVIGMRRSDDTLVWLDVSAQPLYRAHATKPYAAVVTLADISARRDAEAGLRRSELQLRQAQKMEAVGQLAGGVAHDFNNMLTAIKSYGQLVLEELAPDHPSRADIGEMLRAADRAAALTGQLLAFSRKQLLQLRPTDLGEVVSEMDGMLRRLLVGDAQLVANIQPGLGMVRADRGQIEQVLLNLVVNARDAMPNGGRITIEVANVEIDPQWCETHPTAHPGPHVMLMVSDTGTGMDETTRSRIFEPFFTTKEPGHGTGLGLSTVYGIVKQSGGHIWVYSEPGHGTVFRIYFPRVDAAAATAPVEAAAGEAPHRAATVLLVDDEDSVRRPMRKILERSGYVVFEASSGEEALRIGGEVDGSLDLIITDMMMPGMHGRELIERITASHPGARVLFTSGYADDQIIRRGLLEPDMAFIQKPFTLPALLGKVREVLHQAPA